MCVGVLGGWVKVLGGVKGLVPGLIPVAVPVACPSRRTSASILPLNSRSTPARPLSSASVCRARSPPPSSPARPLVSGIASRTRPAALYRVSPRVVQVYRPPVSLPVSSDRLRPWQSRVALAAGQVLTAAARSSAPRPTPTLRTLPRHPPQHAAHRRPCLCPPHCLCSCSQLCGTCGVFPFPSSSRPAHRVLRTLLRTVLTRPSLLRRLTAG